jgi:hypothetical protein
MKLAVVAAVGTSGGNDDVYTPDIVRYLLDLVRDPDALIVDFFAGSGTTGEAVVLVKPDEVLINLGVETANADLEKAKRMNDDAAAKLLKAIKSLGVEDKHIQADHMEIEIRYRDNDRLAVEGYVARRAYSITLKKTDLFEKLIETGIKNGANRLLGFEYRTTELRKYRDQARKMAIRAAREKAEALAAELDCKVGRPASIQEGGGSYGYGGSRWGWNSFGAMSQNSVQSVSSGGEEGETLPLGQIAVRAQVSVSFDLVAP